jgi:hypothetical protein
MSMQGPPQPMTRLALSAAYICFNDKGADGKALPVTLARLSEASGLHRATLVRHLKHAIEGGWLIEINPSGSKNRNLYPSFPQHIKALTDEGQRTLDSLTEGTLDERSRIPIQLH